MKAIRPFLIIFLVISVFSIAGLSYSREIDQAVQEVDRPIRKQIEEELYIAPKEEVEEEKEEPVVDDGPKTFISEIKLVGVKSLSEYRFKPIKGKYENREVSLTELNILAKEIEREYLRNGIIAAVFVPPQDVKEGIITLRVVEAKMGDLEVKDHSFFEKKRILNYWDIHAGEVIRYHKMSRSLQLMNKNPDRQVKAALHAGTKPETTDVILDVETKIPIHALASFDNEGAAPSGKDRFGVGVRDNNFLFVDDTLIAGYKWGKEFSAIYGFHRVPITNFGTSIMYGYSYSKSAPKKEFEAFGLNSQSRNASFFVYQDIYNKDKYLGELYFGFDANDKTTKQNTGTTNRDRLRVFRAGGNMVYRGFGGITYISPEVSQGVNGFGARRKHVAVIGGTPTSREAENIFTKFNMDISHKRRLPWDVQGIVKFKGQVASEKLMSQEEFGLGGINSVRGYPSGDFLADNGFLVNVELLVPAFFIPDNIKFPFADNPLKDDITGVVFYDFGYGEKRGISITSGTQKSATLGSVGAGIRLRLFNQVVVRCEWGFVVGNPSVTEAADSRFHLSLDFEDQLPTEIPKIRKAFRRKAVKAAE